MTLNERRDGWGRDRQYYSLFIIAGLALLCTEWRVWLSVDYVTTARGVFGCGPGARTLFTRSIHTVLHIFCSF